MPNGFGPAMRIFTKQLKPAFSFPRQKGYISVVFVDDTYVQGNTYTQCCKNSEATISSIRGSLNLLSILRNLCLYQNKK